MSPSDSIVRVDPGWERQHEQMGSKAKFWYCAQDARRWLFKACREGTGEDWAEWIAAEVAALLGLPHATVALADSNGVRGCVVMDFVGDEAALIHGNELLSDLDQDYPKEQHYRVSAHTIENVLRVLRAPSIQPPASGEVEGMSAVEMFLGAQTDRRPLSPQAAFVAASAAYPAARAAWLGRLERASTDALRGIIDRVHAERISPLAREFALALMCHNHRALRETTTAS